MLTRITNRCSMGCTHCMVDATPDGEDMKVETFVMSVTLAKRLGPFILLSGGEPTEHPNLLKMLQITNNEGLHTTLLSNGEFLHDKAPNRRDRILGLVDYVQVTVDPRYYPRHVDVFEHPKVLWETHLRQISPHGRAVTNKIEITKRYPECFNLRSYTRAMGLDNAILALRIAGRMCTPTINVDGSISAGECPSCEKIGHVSDALPTIERNIKQMRCRRCGLFDNLNNEQKRAIEDADDQTTSQRIHEGSQTAGIR